MEDFDEGVLSSAIEMNQKSKTLIEEAYEDGELQTRKTSELSEKGEPKLRTLEEFKAGKLTKRTTYDDDGAVAKVENFPPAN